MSTANQLSLETSSTLTQVQVSYKNLEDLTGDKEFQEIAKCIKTNSSAYRKDHDILMAYYELYEMTKKRAYIDIIQGLVEEFMEEAQTQLVGLPSINLNFILEGGGPNQSKKRGLRGREPNKNSFRKQYKIFCAHQYSHEIHKFIIIDRQEQFIKTRDLYVDHGKNFKLAYDWENNMHRVIDNDFMRSYEKGEKLIRSLERYKDDVKRDYKDCPPEKYLENQHILRLKEQIEACIASKAFNCLNILRFYVIVTFLIDRNLYYQLWESYGQELIMHSFWKYHIEKLKEFDQHPKNFIFRVNFSKYF